MCKLRLLNTPWDTAEEREAALKGFTHEEYEKSRRVQTIGKRSIRRAILKNKMRRVYAKRQTLSA
jgi:hypothetical protein